MIYLNKNIDYFILYLFNYYFKSFFLKDNNQIFNLILLFINKFIYIYIYIYSTFIFQIFLFEFKLIKKIN